MPLLATGGQPVPRTLYWRVNTAGLNQRAIRDGNWKLMLDGLARLYLFDLVKDPGEHDDVAASNTAVVRKLRQLLVAWEKDVDSEANAQPR
jgi:arylsulfatase A-like enzyme